MLLTEHVYCVAGAFKMTEQIEQWICIKFCIKLEHFSVETIGWFRRLQLWVTGDWQLHHSNAPTHTSCLLQSFLETHPISQVTRAPYSPDLVSCNFWLLSKPKSPWTGKRFQTLSEIQENTMGQLMASGRTVWGFKVQTLKGTEVSLSYVQCFLYLLSSSINVFIFHVAWLDTFWKYLFTLAPPESLSYTSQYTDSSKMLPYTVIWLPSFPAELYLLSLCSHSTS